MFENCEMYNEEAEVRIKIFFSHQSLNSAIKISQFQTDGLSFAFKCVESETSRLQSKVLNFHSSCVCCCRELLCVKLC